MAEKNRDVLGIIESRWALAQQFGAIPIIGALVFSYAASFLEIMQEYAPLSYVGAAVVGAILFQAWAVLRSIWSEHRLRANRYRELQEPKGSLNPRAKIFQDTRIFLNDLVLPREKVIKNKKFINCDVVGPLNIHLHGNVVLEHSDGTLDVVVSKNRNPAFNAVVFENPTFSECTFHQITIIIPKTDKDLIDALQISGANIITEIPTQD